MGIKLEEQGKSIAGDLDKQGVKVAWDSEMVAMIAYLQRVGRGPQAPAVPEQKPLAAGDR